MAAKKITLQIASRMANPGLGANPGKMKAPMGAYGGLAGPWGGPHAFIPQPGPAAPTAPAAPGAAAGGTPGDATAPDDPTAKYKDPTYFAAAGQNLFTRTSGLAQLGENDKRLNEDAQTSRDRLAQNYAAQQQNINETANGQGLFYSGILGKRQGDARIAYKNQDDDIGRSLSRALDDDQSKRTGLLTQYGDPNDPNDLGLAGKSLLAEAGQRWLTNNPVPATVTGRPGENGLPQGFNTGGWKGLAPGYTIEWDAATGKAKRIVKL